MVIEALNTDGLLNCVDRCHELNSFSGSMSAGSYGCNFTLVSSFKLCYIIPLSEYDSLEYVIVITVYRDNAGKI